ncbi:EAL domain-containing protein [Methylobacter sp.]|jgi:EAL domain-containing protein (putative c-di-GMP-specific phosphodiesterase class I)|uniref:EAL domain-containing protein n=1 Tax=Methylobacter sp. TaxID=2051955 RepID=UPI003DA552D3
MPLQQLVEYFNDRFEREHRSRVRTFILEDGKISGLFGPIRIGSIFAPIRHADRPEQIAGHAARISVSTYESHERQTFEIENLLTDAVKQPVDFESIISLDRLCRTVHMLNYLPASHFDGVLVLEVDPRHIFGIKRDHGAYFEEVIVKCGLATHNVVIAMTVNNFYSLHPAQLLEGLNNYRNRGYRIALNLVSLHAARNVRDLITQLAPDYLRINAPRLDQATTDSTLLSTLTSLKALADSVAGQTILQQVDRKEQATLANQSGFDLVQGSFYEEALGGQSPVTIPAARALTV